jgi:hypothetical protein
MEAQQTMELLLARVNANMKEHIQETKAEKGRTRRSQEYDRRNKCQVDINHAKATKQEEMLAEISARMDTTLN